MTSAAPGAGAQRALFPPGTRLGRYEIVTHLASGGMANVYLGRAHGVGGFQRLVAIKCLHPHIAADEQFVTMFMDEARLAARIRHPNVVDTLDLANAPEGLYLVMDYVEGDSLLGILRQTVKVQRPIPAAVSLRIMFDVLHGLHAAHELRGDSGEDLRLVHRDVSPHNVLVGIDGVTRITDFGIARAEERVHHTKDGQIKGKLSYMAPEQTAGETADRRADTFCAGIVLWECLAARRLFRGQTDAEVLRNLLDAPIPPLDCPPPLNDVVLRALERDKSKRFQTALAFAEALEDAATTIGIAQPRTVAAFVRDMSGEALDEMRTRIQGWDKSREDEGETSVRKRSPTPNDSSSAEAFLVRKASPRRGILFAALAAALVLIGALVATITILISIRRNPSPPSSPPPATVTVTVTQTAAAPSIEIVETQPIASAAPSTKRTLPPNVRPTARPSASTPTGTPSSFNPEAM